MSETMEKECGLSVKDDTRKSDSTFSENGLRVLRARYLKKDESGQCTESPRDMFRRVAGAVAQPETLYDTDPDVRSEWEDRFYSLMISRRFMPNSPTLMNAGREMGMLSACFVLPVGDSINEIFDSIKHTALIQKAGGGTGFAFDELRPTGDYISSSGGTTSGPISFWRAFSEATNAIQQGAFRRGANMGMMYIHHPDILKFLHAKEDLTQFTNYNISVKVTDEWMDRFIAEPDSPHVVRNPRTGRTYLMPKDLEIWEYDIRSLVEVSEDDACPDGEFYTRQDMWDIIVSNAHRTGEPGVVFIDPINRANPTPHLGRIEATNPCGEQPLLPYEACNLGSVNLAKFVRAGVDDRPTIDWNGLEETVHEATRFLDNVIDANKYPLEEIDAVCKANRKIGLGIMGFADALYMLGIPYDSEEGVELGERFMKFINDEAHNYSEKLARRRGSFPSWEGSTYDTEYHRPMRNATCTTVAPTGTISIIAGCSGGIEPMYSLAFYRNVLREQERGDKPMIEVNPIFEAIAVKRGFLSEGLMERIATDGTLAGAEEVPAEVKQVFVCAHDIAPEWHMRMQGAFQKHCDASISKTINFPESATVDEVAEIYKLAYELDCKGVTVYRNGCRDNQPMALKSDGKGQEKNTAEQPLAQQKPLEPAVLPEICAGIRVRQLTPFGNMHINITVDPVAQRELEVFAQLGKGGDLANSDLEAICRMISLWLRSGGSLLQVVRQLHSIGSSLQVHTKEGKIMSLGDGLARGLKRYMRAKADAGLRALLVGDAPLDAPRNAAQAKGQGDNGKGGNGKGSNGNGQKQTQTLDREAAPRTVAPVPSRMEAMGIQWQQTQYKVVCPDCQGPLRFNEGCVACDSCGFSKC
ncbi:MAG: vitamin B12-dependent ribonucleotide reductase [Phycisphaerales bacterium]|nr:MAG: vitamin B12-dependent ribonucleotide reductase [Phycisphaerales bacterium]